MMVRCFAAAGALTLALVLPAAAETAPGSVEIVDGVIATPLTDVAGDPARGREWFAGRKLGNCLACHQNDDLSEEQFHGEVGPELNGVADRWSPEELRAIVVNSKQVFGDQTIMPAFYRDGGYFRVLGDFEGQPILDAQQVEDIVAYLMTLKEQ